MHTKVKVSMDNMLESELFGMLRADLNKNMQSNFLGEGVSKMSVLGDKQNMLPLVMKTREKHVEWCRRAIELRCFCGVNSSESLQAVEPHGFLQSRFFL